MLSTILTLVVLGLLILAFCKEASIEVWLIGYVIIALLIYQYSPLGMFSQLLLFLLFILLIIGVIKPLRRQIFSKLLFRIAAKAMPTISATEKEALEAGTVSWEGDIFSGSPDFNKLHALPIVDLTEEEKAFIAGPVNQLCRMLDDWNITHNQTHLPPEVWQHIKQNRFLGMIIPKQYGGLEFSATAQTAILATIYGRSISAATTISVPNSLGPAELLLKYGTETQKNYYLPRLADGREIPCFALTGPNAGSDAASIPDKGIVCRQMIDEQEITGIRLNWNKRYITLCPVATIIGLAFRLYDPENLLGKGIDIGISCALIPANTAGVITGRRHFPLNTGFLNGPTQGKDVFIPLDYLIGGAVMAGNGWRMLMECLSAGRAISLPSSAMGGAQAAALASGAYARVRKQFNVSISQFEGIEEPLARIAANTYMIDAGLTMAAAAIDHGAKPAVAGAILKYHTTEKARQIAMDAMDIHGGKGICLGPKNYLGRGYQNAPISITVEGANILTRSLIIFGQGAMRCHPYLYRELASIQEKNLTAFDQLFWSHASFVCANLFKSFIFAFTDGRFSKAPANSLKRYYQLINRYSSNLVFAADFCMIFLGSNLKRREKLSARLGDVLSNLYLVCAVLKRFHREQQPLDDLPIVHLSCQQLLYECEVAITGIINNFPQRGLAFILKLIMQPFGIKRQKPSDKLGRKAAKSLSEPNEARNRLTRFVFTEPLANCPIGRLETAFNKLCAIENLEKIIIKAVKENKLQALTLMEQIEEALQAGLINQAEALLLKEAELLRQEVIAVDDFADEELRRSR